MRDLNGNKEVERDHGRVLKRCAFSDISVILPVLSVVKFVKAARHLALACHALEWVGEGEVVVDSKKYLFSPISQLVDDVANRLA